MPTALVIPNTPQRKLPAVRNTILDRAAVRMLGGTTLAALHLKEPHNDRSSCKPTGHETQDCERRSG
eukprot:7840075-Alexandrium_andersonii.AAC.1